MNDKTSVTVGVITGMTAAYFVILFFESIASGIFPTPSTIDWADEVQVKTFMQTAPMGMYALVLSGYFFASIAAGWITNYITRETRYQPALIAGIGLMVFGILNMLMLWHPTWFWVASIPLYLLGAWVGGRMVQRVRNS